MVVVRYMGLLQPKAAFEELRPLHEALIRMQMQYRPFGPDYLVLYAAQQALVEAARHFTGDPDFYAARPH